LGAVAFLRACCFHAVTNASPRARTAQKFDRLLIAVNITPAAYSKAQHAARQCYDLLCFSSALKAAGPAAAPCHFLSSRPAPESCHLLSFSGRPTLQKLATRRRHLSSSDRPVVLNSNALICFGKTLLPRPLISLFSVTLETRQKLTFVHIRAFDFL
jgi:hypothetical protein